MDNNQIRPGGFSILPPAVKNLLIINGLFFLAIVTLQNAFGIDLNALLGMYYIGSENFMPIQFISYMFLHANIEHLFFNMFALWIFGNSIENVWGAKRFLIYYFATGIGAIILHQLVQYVEVSVVINELNDAGVTAEMIKEIIASGKYNPMLLSHVQESDLYTLYSTYNTPTVGASGSVFGILMAFGMLFPNAIIYLYFAIPVKAKWLVIGYGLLELWSGIAASQSDNIAHFAHLGGMIFGFILIKLWEKRDNNRQWI